MVMVLWSLRGSGNRFITTAAESTDSPPPFSVTQSQTFVSLCYRMRMM
jgi:hypothetical protein